MLFIDTHTHIYLPEFDDERDEVVKRAKDSGVGKLILPAIDSSTHQAMIAVEENYADCFSMIGLHPCSVKQDFEKEMGIIEEFLAKRKFVAIGETGLDFYWDKTFTKEQYEAFRRQIAIALTKDLPVVIHSRNAIDECIEVVNEFPGSRGVFHCFSGNYEQAVKIIDAGYYLGIGGVMTFKNSGLDKVMEKLGGLDMIVLETDAPYLAPVPFRGKRNEPSYTRLVAEKLAMILNRPLEEIAELTTENALHLFKL